jgi:hypothetical protein
VTPNCITPSASPALRATRRVGILISFGVPFDMPISFGILVSVGILIDPVFCLLG